MTGIVPTPAQRQAIERTTELFRAQPEVLALFLGGSLAHGFATEASDVDVMIVVSDAEWARRSAEGRTTYFTRDLCAYEGGYVDGKYVSPGFLADVAARGSEPARFAFQDAQVLFARDEAVARLAAAIPRYPVAEKADRIARFAAQLEAWTWYAGEAFKKDDLWLVSTSVSRVCLFAGRMVLAHNELLFPFHKWFLRVLEGAREKPPEMVERIRALARAPSAADVTAFADEVRGFRAWESDRPRWPVLFMRDTELDWLHRSPAVEAI
jgi:hypothetical protein